jgi:hypothetical protein
MPATDYLKQIYDRAWALLEAHAPFADVVKPGNRIKFESVNSGAKSNDYPRVAILPPTLDDTLFTLTQNYQHNAAFNIATMAWTEDLSVTLRVVLAHREARLSTATPLIVEALTALRKGGPAWGLSIAGGNLMRIGPVAANTVIANGADPELADIIDTQRRLITNISIPILLRLQGAQLVT